MNLMKKAAGKIKKDHCKQSLLPTYIKELIKKQEKLMNNLKNNKSPGHDKITNEYRKYGGDHLYFILKKWFNKSTTNYFDAEE